MNIIEYMLSFKQLHLRYNSSVCCSNTLMADKLITVDYLIIY